MPSSATYTDPRGSIAMPVGVAKPAGVPSADCPLSGERVASGRERLDAVVDGVGDEQPAGGVEREPARRRQLPRLRAGGAERAQVVAVRVEHLDAVVGGVGDVRVARRVAGERAREVQLRRVSSRSPPHAPANVSCGVSLTTRSLMSSATYTSPAASSATP